MNTTFPAMRFFSRKLIKPEDLNSHGTLFGGSVLAWIDEEAAIYVICQLGKSNIATKFMSEIDFVSSAKLGDIIEIGMETVAFGTTSITVRCEVRHKFTLKPIIRRSEEHTSELQSRGHLVCRLLLEKKKQE